MSDLWTIPEVVGIRKPDWIVPGWIRARTLTMISAPGGVGKSNFATALALSASQGKPFLDQGGAHRPIRVVYIALDAASWDHAHVTRRLCAGMGIDPESASPEEAWEGGMWFYFKPFLLTDPEKFEGLMNEAAYGSGKVPDLVVVDSLRNIHDNDENDSQSMMAVMRFFRHWAEKEAAILLLHHSKKPGEFTSQTGWDSARGSGVIHNSVDSHLVLKPVASKRTAGKNLPTLRTVTWAKGRGGDETSTLKYRITWSEEAMKFALVRRGRPTKPKRRSDGFVLSPQRSSSGPENPLTSHPSGG